MTWSDLTQLKRLLEHPSCLLTDQPSLEKYSHDATETVSYPSAVLLAQSINDIQTAVNYCREHQVPVVARGAGTGLSGGCVASSDALVISSELLTNLSIDPQRMIAFCGPGLLTKVLQDKAASLGLAYPPDPASYTESTLGGNVAENAGGLRCKRYGVTRDYVIGLKSVLADGSLIKTGVYSVNRGFGLGDLFIGSEGTLAIITEIAVRLTAALGRGTTLLISFDRPDLAAEAVSEIIGSGIIPNVMEYIDGGAAELSARWEKNDRLGSVAALLLFETAPECGAQQTEQILSICQRHHSSAIHVEPDPTKADPLWSIRRNISKALKEMATVRVSEDISVPVSRFPELVAYVALRNAASSLRVNSFGHVGDGNLHVNFLSMTGSETDRQLIESEVDSLMATTLELGGTITGEHGVGLAKRKYLALEFDRPTLAAMTALKSVFDPHALFNPGKIF